MDNISAEEYAKMIKEQCIFCKIGAGEIESKKIYEDAKVIAFLDINPASPGHTLVVPKQHATFLPQLSDQATAHLFAVVKRLSGILYEITQETAGEKQAGVNILQNNGGAAGQQVPHLHVHLIPRVEGDGVVIPWQPNDTAQKAIPAIQSKLLGMLGGGQQLQVPVQQPQPTAHPAPVQQAPQTEEPKPEAPKEKPRKRIERSP